jgi:hypothetical protein
MSKQRKTREICATKLPRRWARRHLFAPAAVATLLGGADAPLAERQDPQENSEHERADVRPAGAGSRPRDIAGELGLAAMAEDDDREVQARAAAALASAMERMTGFERAELVASWASSFSPGLRLAIARALCYAPPTVADLVAIEHLAADRVSAVRLAIAQAAWLRRAEAPDPLGAILGQLARDPDRAVRLLAEFVLDIPRADEKVRT